MRIEKLRLRNLNSLAGDWTVDFTHPAFSRGALFAVTGPTGSGKSTLLDAVTLALYGCTPRLGRLSKSDNSLMSLHAGDCLAELTFSTGKGRFRACWSQRRARKKPGGELQPPRHELADAATGEVLETRLKEVTRRVEEVTGMDYERFSRSVLLPQGRFADFLMADPETRGSLLEQITGTEIYRDISIETHKRLREEQAALDALHREIHTVSLMTPEEEADARAAIAEKTARLDAALSELARAERRLAWLEEIERLREQAAETAAALARKQAEEGAFRPERERLARAERALELAATHSALDAQRAELRREEQAAAGCEAAIPGLRKQADAAAAAFARAEAALAARRGEQEAAAPLFQRVRALDTSLREKEAALRPARAHAERLAAALAARREDSEETRKTLEAKTRRLEEDLRRVTDALAFADAREQLRDGAPCPLCGALDHPFARGGVPAPDATRRRLDEAREELRRAASEDAAQAAHTVARLEAEAGSLALAALEAERAHIAADRAALFGARPVDAEEKRLARALREEETALTDAARARDESAAARAHAEQRRAQLRADATGRRERIAPAEAAFAAAAREKGFPDETAFLAALLPEAVRSSLRARANALAAAKAELATRERDTRARLEAETARNLTADPAEALGAAILTLRAESSALGAALGGLQERLRANDAASALRRERIARLEAGRRDCARWEKLHTLIGSHDGAKFRNFAQGLTFDLMIRHANRHLATLSDRYLLVRAPNQPLSLDVVDAYQAGLSRPARTLSGGESFLISLALALGLSSMSSRSARIDSLFLDEGFGSLDPEALDAALTTLSRLHTEGKLICAISHTPEVQSRIPTRLVLTPLPNGNSTLSGPGCSGSGRE